MSAGSEMTPEQREKWDHILRRDTPDGAVEAFILDEIALDRALEKMEREHGDALTGDFLRVRDAINNLRSVFTDEFNRHYKKPCENCGGPDGYPGDHAVGCPLG